MHRTDYVRAGNGARLLAFAACCALVAVPFFSVQFPPVSDLPQHLAQIRLFHETLADPSGAYRIQWLTPYLLGYLPLSLAWQLSPTDIAGRTAMLIVVILWTLAVHWLALERGRAVASAILASALVFNHATYWGFYSFSIGWPTFVLWFLLTTRPGPFRRKDVVLYLGAAWLLYLSHALWLIAGLLWLVLRDAVARAPLRTVALQAVSISPVLLMVAIWYRQLSGFSSPTRWLVTPSGRLSVSWLVDSTLGGLRGPVEYGMIGLLVAWMVVGVYQNRQRLEECVDHDLCLAAALFFGLVLVLPNLHQNTIAFASRWQPIAMIMLVLGTPAPVWSRTIRNAVALTAVAAFVFLTCLAWIRFERTEYAGLRETIAALPADTRVIGLDYVKTSDIVKGRPFLQGFAYAQVFRGGELNFSFAEFAPMAVVYKTQRARPWTKGLEWFAEGVMPSDFAYFDFAVVNAQPAQHAAFLATLPELTPVTGEGRWRLYRIQTTSR